MVEHRADPNLVIPEANIAPIHYAAGMENTDFAESAMKLILKCNGITFELLSVSILTKLSKIYSHTNEGNPNVQTIDGETPLHIAVIWNRTLIVEMLLVIDKDISHQFRHVNQLLF